MSTYARPMLFFLFSLAILVYAVEPIGYSQAEQSEPEFKPIAVDPSQGGLQWILNGLVMQPGVQGQVRCDLRSAIEEFTLWLDGSEAGNIRKLEFDLDDLNSATTVHKYRIKSESCGGGHCFRWYYDSGAGYAEITSECNPSAAEGCEGLPACQGDGLPISQFGPLNGKVRVWTTDNADPEFELDADQPFSITLDSKP